jgi:hypothetical protein
MSPGAHRFGSALHDQGAGHLGVVGASEWVTARLGGRGEVPVPLLAGMLAVSNRCVFLSVRVCATDLLAAVCRAGDRRGGLRPGYAPLTRTRGIHPLGLPTRTGFLEPPVSVDHHVMARRPGEGG